ncbi:URC4/urg3 family protein [Mycobacterium sp. NPDC050551]|uniref:URC4/urg3 family protein n=1 Tax=Mycobacterium sp. NPDC050551 TaxID=3155407 RepID=UPI0034388B96
MSTIAVTPDTATADGAATALRSPAVIRERARHLLDRGRSGGSPWFVVRDDALPHAATEVAAVTRNRFPDLRIPYHSRWRHFEAGGVDRRQRLESNLTGCDPAARARTMIDLAVVSVLLDAGAGPEWVFREQDRTFTRSEGLAVAGMHAFETGLFSSDPDDPYRVDAAALRALTTDALAGAFQVGPDNPLLGLDGRAELLRRLGAALTARPDVFGPHGRPGGLFDALAATGGRLSAPALLAQLLTTMAPIWPADNAIGDQRLGDCWRHDAVPGPGLTAGWMPFHKLSQWLTYSLLEPFEWAGVQVDDVDALTGLPEYRNGGLLLDTGVLQLRDAAWTTQTWRPGDELVVEWRALTVALLDDLAPLVRAELGAGTQDLPLACILEGGTWATGRALAGRLRGGLPPLTVSSDGTVF